MHDVLLLLVSYKWEICLVVSRYSCMDDYIRSKTCGIDWLYITFVLEHVLLSFKNFVIKINQMTNKLQEKNSYKIIKSSKIYGQTEPPNWIFIYDIIALGILLVLCVYVPNMDLALS